MKYMIFVGKTNQLGGFFFFLREFQPIASAFNDNSLSSDQDTN